MNESASKGEADWSDEPTGRRIFAVAGRIRPMGHLWQGFVRTSQLLTHDIQVLVLSNSHGHGLKTVESAESGVFL
jgi:hypothetical protein